MRITERLDVEHRLLLQELEDVADLVRCGGSQQAWQGAAGTFAHVLSRHNGVEERLVYSALGAARPECADFIAELENEHRLLERLARDVAQDTSGAAALQLVDTLRKHVEKETYVVFPLAEEVLPVARLRLTRLELVAELSGPARHMNGDWPEHWLG